MKGKKKCEENQKENPEDRFYDGEKPTKRFGFVFLQTLFFFMLISSNHSSTNSSSTT